MKRRGANITFTGANRERIWWHAIGGAPGGVLGALAGTPLTIITFFHFFTARLGPLYDGTGKSGLYILWVLPIAPVWGFFIGGVLVSLAMNCVVPMAERYAGENEWGRLALRWTYGVIAILATLLIFCGGCAVLGYVLQILALPVAS